MYKKLLTLIFIFFLFYVLTGKSYAVDCTSVPISGSYVIPAGGCTFANTVDGVDAGTGSSNSAVLTVPSGRTLTLNANQTIAFGLINIGGNGVIAMSQSGAQLVKQPLWAPNQDGDGYPTSASPALLAQGSQPANHSRRNVLTTLATADCLDTDATKWANQNGYLDADGDTYTTGGASPVCSGASLPTYNSSTSPYRAAVNGDDCNDASATVWRTTYRDADGDLYGTTNTTTCDGTNITTGYVVNSTDCYDSNANAKPGQTTYYNVDRGDGSYDYNCNSVETKRYGLTQQTSTSCVSSEPSASELAGFVSSIPACGVAGTRTQCCGYSTASCGTLYLCNVGCPSGSSVSWQYTNVTNFKQLCL